MIQRSTERKLFPDGSDKLRLAQKSRNVPKVLNYYLFTFYADTNLPSVHVCELTVFTSHHIL